MKPHASDRAQKATRQCRKDFACLKEGGAPGCAVEHCVDGKIHFLKCLKDKVCAYPQAFGYGCLCTCPVRKELFNKHRI
ncbi:MAG: hypothetical protein AB7V22_07580 [Kiritimatiellia bacterium]